MFQRIFTCICLLAVTNILADDINIDFSKKIDNQQISFDKSGEIKKGILQFVRGDKANFSSKASIKLPDMAAYTICFDLKVYDADTTLKLRRLLFELISNKPKTQVLTFSDGKGFFGIYKHENKNVFYNHYGEDIDLINFSANAKWLTVKFVIDYDHIDFYFNEKLIYSKDIEDAGKFKEIAIKNQGYSLDIKNINIIENKSKFTPNQDITWKSIINDNVTLSQYKGIEIIDDTLKTQKSGNSNLHISREYSEPIDLNISLNPMSYDKEKSRLTISILSKISDSCLTIFSKENGTGFFVLFQEKGEKRFYDFYKLPLPINNWIELRLIISNKQIEFYADKKNVCTKKIEMLPISDIKLSTKDCEISIKDLHIKMTSLKKKVTETYDAVIYSKFNAERPEIVFSSGNNYTFKDNEFILKQGVDGQAIQPKNEIILEAKSAFKNSNGSIEFWGSIKNSPWKRNLFIADNGFEDNIKIVTGSSKIQSFIKRRDKLPQYVITLGLVPWKGDNDWAHIVLTWNQDDVRLYVNSMPYSTVHYDKSNIPSLTNPDIDSIKRIRLQPGVVYDNFRVYTRALSPLEVYTTYRKIMPIDLVMKKQVFDVNCAIQLILDAAPGGYYMHPMPINFPYTSTNIELSYTLQNDNDDNIVLSTEPINYNINKETKIEIPQVQLGVGNYTLSTLIKYNNHQFRRSFKVDVCSPFYDKSESTVSDYKKSKLLYTCDRDTIIPKLLGRYNVVKGNGFSYIEGTGDNFGRFGFEIPFPDDIMGKPVIIEIDWPDDKPRMAGHYIYRPSKGYCDRDRLQQGIQSGLQYPLSNKIVTTKYIFWPGFNDYLIEFRNLAKNRPAAFSALRIYSIEDDRLPKLTINKPEGFIGRKFGNLDEDQTFYMNLNRDYYDNFLAKAKKYPNYDTFVFDELGKYFSYVGMNLFQYNLLRYYYVYYMMDTDMSPGFPPKKNGGLDYMIKTLKDNGIYFNCGINISSIPEVAHSIVTEPDAINRGWIMLDKTGKKDGGMFGSRYPNYPTNPEVIQYYINHIKRLAEELKTHDNVTGFSLWTIPWKNLSWGYDDYNVNLFSKETGISIPKSNIYEYLTKVKRKQWLEWRAKKTTKLIEKIAKTLHSINPKWNLIICPQDLKAFQDPLTKLLIADVNSAVKRYNNYYENLSIDIKAIERIPNVYFSPMVMPSRDVVNLYKYNRTEPINELVYSYEADNKQYRTNGRSRKTIGIYHDYIESIGVKNPSPTLLPDKYSCFFQDTDVKPWGRYFLKELVYPIASADVLEISFGAQPIGSLGREEETREFAQAYRALPEASFTDVPGVADPVTVRYLYTDKGTYFYIASMLCSQCDLKLSFAKQPKQIIDLSQNASTQNFNMKAYQLRSFYIPGEKTEITGVKVEIPENVKNYYQSQLKLFIDAVDRTITAGGDLPQSTNIILNKCKQLAESTHYAELHRLLFSKEIQTLINKAKNIRFFSKEIEMIGKGNFAVNCGSDTYYLSQTGKLFFPDQMYSDDNKYGFIGQHKTTLRDSSSVRYPDAQGLFATEAWDIDGYKFKVPNGKYKLKIYMRYSYAPRFNKNEPLNFSAKINNKFIFKDLNIFEEMKKDINNPLILEYPNIEVTDGFLRLDCIASKDSTIRHLVAIEVLKEE